MAVGLRRLDDTPWARDARTALLKVVAGMPEGAAARARTLADGVRLLVQPLSAPDQAIADAVVRAVEDATPIRIDYLDVGGRPTVREVEPHHVVLGRTARTSPAGAGCVEDERVFRIDRDPLGRAAARGVPAAGRRVRRRGLRDAHAGVGVNETRQKHRHRVVAGVGACSVA